MKYWILTTEYPPIYGGGISTYCYHTAQMLKQKGASVKVFIPDHEIKIPTLTENIEGIEVIRFKPEGQEYYSYLGYHAALSYHFFELVNKAIEKEGEPDYIEAQEYLGIAYYLLLKKKTGTKSLQSVPIIVTAHAPAYFYWDNNQYPLYKLPDFWLGEMEKWVLKAADILISPSQYLMDNISDVVSERPQGYHIVRNPFKTNIKNTPSKYTQGDIVFFGKLIYQKGCLQLLNFMTRLWDEKFPYALSIIGGDHFFELKQMMMKDYIIKKYKKYYDKNLIKFEGKLKYTEIEARLDKAHVVIVPSLVDNFPYTVVEGLEMGKVMLVSDGGGQQEMVKEGQTGFVYKQNDPASFKNKMLAIMGLSREQISKIGNDASKAIYEMCHYDNVYKAKMAILKSYTSFPKEYFPFTTEIAKTKHTKELHSTTGLLSIVIPYYNTGKYIEETVINIFETEYKEKEVIIINDGSDEKESIEILNVIQEKYPVKIIHQRNTGLPGARNTGIKEAKGEFIAYLDADDKINPSFYSRAIELLKQYPKISFVSSWVKYFDASTGTWPSHIPEAPFLLLHNMINAGFVSRRVDYFNFGINDDAFEYGMEDYDCNVSMLENGCRGIVIPEPLYYYRIHAASMARQFNVTNQLYSYKLLSKKHKNIYSKFSYEVFNLLLSNGPSYLYDNPTFEPYTDVTKLKNWIGELEKSNQWYDRTLKSYEEQINSLKELVNNSASSPSMAKQLKEEIENINQKHIKEYENTYHIDYMMQKEHIEQLQKNIAWYQDTFENRKIIGIIKDRIIRAIRPKNNQ